MGGGEPPSSTAPPDIVAQLNVNASESISLAQLELGRRWVCVNREQCMGSKRKGVFSANDLMTNSPDHFVGPHTAVEAARTINSVRNLCCNTFYPYIVFWLFNDSNIRKPTVFCWTFLVSIYYYLYTFMHLVHQRQQLFSGIILMVFPFSISLIPIYSAVFDYDAQHIISFSTQKVPWIIECTQM